MTEAELGKIMLSQALREGHRKRFPAMTGSKPDVELRQRVLDYYKEGKTTFEETAKAVGASVGFVHRIIRQTR